MASATKIKDIILKDCLFGIKLLKFLWRLFWKKSFLFMLCLFFGCFVYIFCSFSGDFENFWSNCRKFVKSDQVGSYIKKLPLI